MVTSRRVARRYLLAKLLYPGRRKVGLNLNIPLPTLWYQNAQGGTWIPEEDGFNLGDNPPKGFVYQHSRFPRTLVENVLRLITKEDVDACSHSEVVKDHGLIAGLEGRICQHCGGTQTKSTGTPWPAEWMAGGSKTVLRAESSYPSDLVLAMVRPSTEEIQVALERGHTIQPIDYMRAVLIAASSCERCMNVLMYRHGLDDGYEEGSDQWKRANTRCEMCE